MAQDDPTSGNRVFISTVSDEFEKTGAPFPGLRSELRRYLTRADCEVKVQEDFRQDGAVDTVQKLDGYIRRCAAVLHLVGEKAGAVAHPKAVADYLAAEPDFLKGYPELRAALGDYSDLSYTQWEALMALHHGVPLFVYATPRAGSEQKTHVDRLLMGRKYASLFQAATDLLGQLIGDLRHIIPLLKKPVQRLSKQRFLHHSAEFFLGREKELEMLDQAWEDGTNVVSLIAWGGVGKTALVSEWVQTRFIDKGWTDANGEPCPLAYFDWSFYDQGTGEVDSEATARTGSAASFFEEALGFFGDVDPTLPRKGVRLAQLVREQATLLVLDGLEPLQQPPGHPHAGRLTDPDLRDLLVGLAQKNMGLCVITSREGLVDLNSLRNSIHSERKLEELPAAVAQLLLRRLGVRGENHELAAACEKFACHALTLTLLGRYLTDVHGGDICKVYEVLDLERADELTRPDRRRSAWRVLESYENWLATAAIEGNSTALAVLRIMGVFDRIAEADCLAALRAQPPICGLTDAICGIGGDEWNVLLKRLERAQLIKLSPSSNLMQGPNEAWGIDVHPLVRQYFAKKVRCDQADAYAEAHNRIFIHLQKTTPKRQRLPVDDVERLYHAMFHGCHAGKFEDAFKKVYYNRIQNGSKWHATNVLGLLNSDISGLSHFFSEPWTRLDRGLSHELEQRVLRQAAYSLKALGRVFEAETAATLALSLARPRPDAQGSDCMSATQLSAVKLLLGKINEALEFGNEAVDLSAHYIDKDPERRISSRCTLGNALFQRGNTVEAARWFREAEEINKGAFPVLGKLQGYVFHQLLLAEAERKTWRVVMQMSTLDRGFEQSRCSMVEDRVRLRYPPDENEAELLPVGLARLTLAQIVLYREAFVRKPRTETTCNRTNLCDYWNSHVVPALRSAGQMQHIGEALLGLALAAHRECDQVETAAALEEAQTIAERGPMRLLLADVHLHRARLFRDRGELRKARELIERCGYWRRKEELEDAEEAAENWG